MTTALTFALLLACSLCNSEANAESQSDESELIIETKLLTEGTIYAKQPVTISMTVLTNRWFSKGTRLGQVDIDNAVVLTTSDFAINSTRKINYQTWTTQTRDITFYPMKAGPLFIPAFEVAVSANNNAGNTYETVLYTEPMEILVELPPGVDEKDQYVVSGHYSINVDFEVAKKDQYKVGDAITQTISMTVDDSPGMMLPVLADVNLPGVKVYRKPAEVIDQTDRGMIVGKRKESFTYFFESAGTFTIPKQTFYWFNTQFNELEEVTIDEYTWTVVGKTGIEKAVDDIKNFNFSPAKAMLYLAIILLGLWLIVLLLRHYRTLINAYKKLTKYEQRQVNKLFIKSVSQKQFRSACHYLYMRYDVSDNSTKDLTRLFANESEKLEVLHRLFNLAFVEQKPDANTTISLIEAKTLLSLSKNTKRKSSDKDFDMDDFIDLNKH